MIDHLLSAPSILVYISTILLVEHQRHFLSAIRFLHQPLGSATGWLDVPHWMITFMRITADAYTFSATIIATLLTGIYMDNWYYPPIVVVVGQIISIIYKSLGMGIFRHIFGFKYFTFFGGLWILGYAYYIVFNLS